MIRLATTDDLTAVVTIYNEILDQEETLDTPYTNWQRGLYPTEVHARRALDAGHLYVAQEGADIYGCFILNQEQLPEYAQIPWQTPAAPEEVAVIHTLCVSPRWAGQGKAREIVSFCEGESRRMGAKVIRLDTYEGNIPANAMYPKLGYTFVGSTFFFFQELIEEPLNCYEKRL